jgi:hypothetical protein
VARLPHIGWVLGKGVAICSIEAIGFDLTPDKNDDGRSVTMLHRKNVDVFRNVGDGLACLVMAYDCPAGLFLAHGGQQLNQHDDVAPELKRCRVWL